jgi:hypothetical protein
MAGTEVEGVEGRRCQCSIDQEAYVRADLDTLVIALYCAACALFPSERTPRRGPPELISVSARFQVNDFDGVTRKSESERRRRTWVSG